MEVRQEVVVGALPFVFERYKRGEFKKRGERDILHAEGEESVHTPLSNH